MWHIGLFGNKKQCSSTQKSLPQRMVSLINNPSCIDATWMTSRYHPKDYIFISKTLEINADIEAVFAAAKQINRYYEFSNGAVDAQIDGEISRYKEVQLKLYKNKFIGKFILPVKDTVIVADKDKVNGRCIIGWGLPLFGQLFTERYQVIKHVAPGKVQITIGDKIPGIVGFISHLFYKNAIISSFDALNEGIKKEVESHKPQYR